MAVLFVSFCSPADAHIGLPALSILWYVVLSGQSELLFSLFINRCQQQPSYSQRLQPFQGSHQNSKEEIVTLFPARVRFVAYFQFVLRSLFLIRLGILLYFMFWDSATEPTFVSFSHLKALKIPKLDPNSVNSTVFCRFPRMWLKVSSSSSWVLKKTWAMKLVRAHVHIFFFFSCLSVVLIFGFHARTVLAEDVNYMQK